MKKKILLLCFVLLGLYSLQAQNAFVVGGYVTNLNGGAINNHPVYIMSDSVGSFIFSAVTYTNNNGYYTFAVTNVPALGQLVNFYVYTYDCNGVVHTTIVTNANPQNVVNFSICNGTTTTCNAVFTHTLASAGNNTVNFHDISFGNPVSWLWSFGDGTSSTLQNPVHSYNAIGSYVICLTITTASNCTSVYCDSIYIQGSTTNTCNANFTYFPDSNSTLNTVHFVNNSSTTYQNYLVNYLWNFGDNTTSTLQNPSHAFTLNPIGGYNVCLTMQVVNSVGTVVCSDTYCQYVIVSSSGNNCQNSFVYTHQNLFYAFNGHINSVNPTTYFWNFGDGTSATGQNVTHTFIQPAPGINGYHVCLTTVTSNNNGTSCTDSTCQFVSLNSNPAGNIIQGYVIAGNYNVNDGYVLLYQANNAMMSYTLIDTLMLDSIGYFHFEYLNVPPVNPAFLIKAVLNSTAPYYNQFAPTFYQNTVNWYNATPVFPSANSVYYYINMIQLPTPIIGNGSFSGNVFQGGTKSSTDIPLSGVELILTDENDAPLKINYSNTIGVFNFNSLPMGNYKLHIEIAGINYTPYPFTLSTSNPAINNISVIVNNSGAIITGIENELKSSAFISEIYPNPATSAAFLEINNTKSENFVVTVYDIRGKKLTATEYKVNGNQLINLNNNHLSTGIYTVKIETLNGLNIIRKMVISK